MTATLQASVAEARPLGRARIRHVVHLMLENRSFDNLIGWLYAECGNRPPRNLPAPSAGPPHYDGLEPNKYWNPIRAEDLERPPHEVPEAWRAYATRGAATRTTPDPDPNEQFQEMNEQLLGHRTPTPGVGVPAAMNGFVVNYARAVAKTTTEPRAIMQCYAPDQVPILSALARNYAVCDRWFASAPCQTFPNRSFAHAGTACGRVNNLNWSPDDNTPPDPRYYDTRTIFNVLADLGISWAVYADHRAPLLTTLTGWQFLEQVGRFLAEPGRFANFAKFCDDAAAGALPAYSFIEPSFLDLKNDQHPPHDVAAGEALIHAVWRAVRESKHWNETLLVISYDEHGGCYDHVSPPCAVPPDHHATQAGFEFGFDRYGVRVPAVLISPWIEAGTVFRSPTLGVEYDHTSLLATLRDWLDLERRAAAAGVPWLASERIARAPTLAQVLDRDTPRVDYPPIPAPASTSAPNPEAPLTGLQHALIAAALKGTRHELDVAVKGISHFAPLSSELALSKLRELLG